MPIKIPEINVDSLLEGEVSPDSGLQESPSGTSAAASSLARNSLVDTEETVSSAGVKIPELSVKDITAPIGPQSPAMKTSAADPSLAPSEFKRIDLLPGNYNFERRAEAQTVWDLTKGAFVQSLAVGVGGTIENFGYLAELFNPEFRAAVMEGEFEAREHGLAAFGREIQERAREWQPVYLSENAQEGFAPGEGAWWASHIPSIFSSVGLIIPGGAIGALASNALRLARFNATVQQGGRILSAGLASRHMYSSLESAQLYEERYEDLINRRYSEQEARENAGVTAGSNYIMGYANLWKDMLAWSVVFKGINHSSRALQNRAHNWAANAPKNSVSARILAATPKAKTGKWHSMPADLLKVGLGEAVEEVNIQYQKALATRWADSALGLYPAEDRIKYFSGNYFDGANWGEHMRDRHTWDSAFWGFMGGVTFGAIGRPGVKAIYNKTERARQQKYVMDLESQIMSVNEAIDAHLGAESTGNAEASSIGLDSALEQVDIKAAQQGTLDINIEMYKAMAEATPEQLQEMGLTPEAGEAAQRSLDRANHIKERFNKYMDSPAFAGSPYQTNYAARAALYSYKAQESRTKTQEADQARQASIENDIAGYDILNEEGKGLTRKAVELMGLNKVIKGYENAIARLKRENHQNPMEKRKMKYLEKELKKLKEQATKLNQDFEDSSNAFRKADPDGYGAYTAMTNSLSFTHKAVKAQENYFDNETSIDFYTSIAADVMNPEVIKETDAFLEKETAEIAERDQELARKAKEKEAKTEAKAESDTVKKDNARENFLSSNQGELNSLGYTQNIIDSMSLEDLTRVVEEGIAVEDFGSEPADSASPGEIPDIPAPDADGPAPTTPQEVGINEYKRELEQNEPNILSPEELEKITKKDEQTEEEAQKLVKHNEAIKRVDAAVLKEIERRDTSDAFAETPLKELHDPSNVTTAQIKSGEVGIEFLTSEDGQTVIEYIENIDGYAYYINIATGEILDGNRNEISVELRNAIIDFILSDPKRSDKFPESKVVQRFKISGKPYRVTESGLILDDKGKAVTDPKVIAKIELKKEVRDHPERRLTDDSGDYFYTLDGRLVSLKTAEEVFTGDAAATVTRRKNLIEKIMGKVPADPAGPVDNSVPVSTIDPAANDSGQRRPAEIEAIEAERQKELDSPTISAEQYIAANPELSEVEITNLRRDGDSREDMLRRRKIASGVFKLIKGEITEFDLVTNPAYGLAFNYKEGKHDAAVATLAAEYRQLYEPIYNEINEQYDARIAEVEANLEHFRAEEIEFYYQQKRADKESVVKGDSVINEDGSVTFGNVRFYGNDHGTTPETQDESGNPLPVVPGSIETGMLTTAQLQELSRYPDVKVLRELSEEVDAMYEAEIADIVNDEDMFYPEEGDISAEETSPTAVTPQEEETTAPEDDVNISLQKDEQVAGRFEGEGTKTAPVSTQEADAMREDTGPGEGTVAWRSTRWDGRGNEPATAFFEDMENNVEGREIEFGINVGFQPEGLKQPISEGKPIKGSSGKWTIEINGEDVPVTTENAPSISFAVLREDGTGVQEVNGEPVYAYVKQPHSRNTLDRVVHMYNAALAGRPIRSKLTKREHGAVINAEKTEDGLAPIINPVEFFDAHGISMSEVEFGIANTKGRVINSKGDVVLTPNDPNAGNFYIGIPSYDGTYFPYKANNRMMTRNEAQVIVDLIDQYLSGQIDMDTLITPDINEHIHGITMRNILDLMLFHGMDPTNIYTNQQRNEERIFYVNKSETGNPYFQYGQQTYKGQLTSGQKKALITQLSHATTGKKRHINLEGLGKQRGRMHSLFAITNQRQPFTWFGKEHNPAEEGSYLNFIFESDGTNGAVASVNLDMNSYPLPQPRVKYTPDFTQAEPVNTAKRDKQRKEQEAKEPELKEQRDEQEEFFSKVDGKKSVPKFSAQDRPQSDPPRDLSAIEKRLEAILPPGVKIVSGNEGIDVVAAQLGHENPALVMGIFYQGMIALRNNASDKVAFHEAFHAVFNLSLTQAQQRRIYDAATVIYERRHKKKPENDLVLEEFLADEFAEYMENDGVPSLDITSASSIKEFFSYLWSWVKNVFSSDAQINRFYNNISSGMYARMPRKDEYATSQIPARFSAEAKPFGPAVRNSVVKALAFAMAQDAGYGTDRPTQAIDTTELNAYIKAFWQDAKDNNDVARRGIWYAAAQNEAKIREELHILFTNMQLDGKKKQQIQYSGQYEDMFKETTEVGEEGYIERDGTMLYIPTAYESPAWDKATANAKFAVFFTPQLEVREKTADGRFQFKWDENTGMPQFVQGRKLWEIILDEVSGVQATSKLTIVEAINQRLEKASYREPSVAYLLEQLQSEAMPAYKKNQVYYALANKVNLNFHTMTHGVREFMNTELGEMDSSLSVSIFESDLHRQGNKIHSHWKTDFVQTFFTLDGDGYTLNKPAVQSVIDMHQRFLQNVDIRETDVGFQEISDILETVGVDFDMATINRMRDASTDAKVFGELSYFLNQIIVGDPKQKFGTSLKEMLHLSNQKGYLHNQLAYDKNPITNVHGASTPIVREMAREYYRYNPEFMESSVFAANGKSKYTFTSPNYYFNTLAKMQQDVDFFDQKDTGRMTQNLRLYRSLNKLKYTVVANVKRKDSPDEGRDIVDSGFLETLRYRYNAMLKGMAATVNFSDKKTNMYLSGLTLLDETRVGIRASTSDRSIDGVIANLSVGSDMIEAFTNLLENEMRRTAAALGDIQSMKAQGKENQLYETYHYEENADGTRNYEAGRGTQFVMFEFLEYNSLKRLADKHESYREVFKLLYGEGEQSLGYNPKMRPHLRAIVNAMLKSQFRQELVSLQEMGIVNENMGFNVPLIDKKTGRRYAGEGRSPNLTAVAVSFFNSTLYTIEQSLLVQGDPAAFKNFDDWNKRTSGPAAFRDSLLQVDPKVGATYNIAILRDVIKPSENIGPLIDYFSENGVSDKVLRTLKKAYESVNTTDAQAYITLDRFEKIMRGETKWKEEYSEIVSEWKKGNTNVLKTAEGAAFMDLLMTPIKGVHYGIERTNPMLNVEMPVYLKYSQFVLLPGMAEMDPSGHLQAMMDAMDQNNIDELVFESGVKVGRRGKAEANFDTMVENLVPMTLQNENWGRQVATPTHFVTTDGLYASQIKRNIFLAIREGRDYGGLSAEQLTHALNELTSEFTERGLEGITTELNLDVDGTIRDYDSFSERMKQEAEDRDSPTNVKEAFDLKNGKFRVATDLHPNPSTTEAMIMSMFENEAISPSIYGGSFVQASSFGFTSYAALTPEQRQKIDEAVAPEEGEAQPAAGLRSPHVVDGVLQSAEVLVPSWFGDHIKAKTGKDASKMSRTEIQEFFKANPDLLEFIGYRIPNQGPSSIETLKVVGFLPEDLGDTIVVYEELTQKNDSDFDVDKMFGFFPRFYVNDQGEMVKYKMHSFRDANGDLIESQLKKVYNDRYKKSAQIKEQLKFFKLVDDMFINKGWSSNALAKKYDNVTAVGKSYKIGNMHRKQLKKLANSPRMQSRLDSIPTFEEFKEKARYYSDAQANSIEGNWNQYLELMKLAMHNPVSMAESMIPIVDEAAVDWASQFASENGYRENYPGITQFFPTSQSRISKRFRDGTKLVGSPANHLSSHGLATRVPITISKKRTGRIPEVSYVGRMPDRMEVSKDRFTTTIGRIQDYQGNDITLQISTVLSGFLDATSKGWALDVNLNGNTINAAMYLIRVGFGFETTMKILNQPGVRMYSMLQDRRADRVFRGSAYRATKNQMKEEAQNAFFLMKAQQNPGVARKDTDAEFKELQKKVAKMIDDHTKGNPHELRIEPRLLDMAFTQPEGNQTGIMKAAESPASLIALRLYVQEQILDDFVEFEQEGSKLSNAVGIAKYDAGIGSSLASMQVHKHKANQLREADQVDITSHVNNTFLKSAKRVHDSAEKVMSRQSIGGTSTAMLVQNLIMNFTGLEHVLSRDENFLRDVNNALKTFIVQRFPSIRKNGGEHVKNPVHMSAREFKSMFYGENSMARRVGKLLDTAPQDVRESMLMNMIAPNIDPMIRTTPVGNKMIPQRPEFLETTYKKMDPVIADQITADWSNMLAHSNAEVREFANDLFKYAVATSGFRRGMNSLYHFVPTELTEQLTDYYDLARHTFLKVESGSQSALSVMHDFLMNEAGRFEDLAPMVNDQDILRVVEDGLGGVAQIEMHYSVASQLMYSAEDVAPGMVRLGEAMYIKTVESVVNEASEADFKIENRSPVKYQRIGKKGFDDGSFRIFEYGNPASPSALDINTWYPQMKIKNIVKTIDATLGDNMKKYREYADGMYTDGTNENRDSNMDQNIQDKPC